MQQVNSSAEGSSRLFIKSAEDLAAKLCAFASDGIVLKHLIEFALPPKKRQDAAEVTAKVASVPSESQNLQLQHHDDSHEIHAVSLSQRTAKAMADSFFKFVQQEHLQRHLTAMSAGQIVVLCIFHSRLSWQKGKRIQLHEKDQYWLPRPVYTPASQVEAPSPPHFVKQLQAPATERSQPVLQPPCTLLPVRERLHRYARIVEAL